MDLTVKELKALLKEHKSSTNACGPYSKLRKAELINRVKELNLVESDEPVRKSRDRKILDKLKITLEKQNPTSAFGKKKKASAQRQIERIGNLISSEPENPRIESALIKLSNNVDKVIESL